VFYVLTIIAMSFFLIEIILASISKEGYFLGFYFWLDLIATLSLIFDIGWFWDAILGTGGTQANAASAAKAAKAGRGARVGTRASRIARIVRLIRLIRIVKLYKSANAALAKEDDNLEEN
jgi:Ion transport protein